MNKRQKKKKLKNRMLQLGVLESSFNMRRHSSYDLTIMTNAMKKGILNRNHCVYPVDIMMEYAAIAMIKTPTAFKTCETLKEAIQKISSGENDTGVVYSIDSLPGELFRHPSIDKLILRNDERLTGTIKDLPFSHKLGFGLRALASVYEDEILQDTIKPISFSLDTQHPINKPKKEEQ